MFALDARQVTKHEGLTTDYKCSAMFVKRNECTKCTVKKNRPTESTEFFHGRFLRSEDFWLQNCAILRNATLISLPVVSSEKHAAQRCEKLRNSLGLNYESAALDS